MTANEIEARKEAQEAADRLGEIVILFSRSCDRWFARRKSEAKSAYAYATEVAKFKPVGAAR